MGALLLGTGERELVEASPFDRVWGIGFREKDVIKAGRDRWGQNLLGKALMEVRGLLRAEEDAGGEAHDVTVAGSENVGEEEEGKGMDLNDTQEHKREVEI